MSGAASVRARRRWPRRVALSIGLLALALALIAGGVVAFAPQRIVQALLAHKSASLGLASRQVDVDGVRWHYYEAGQGQTVVLVHGIASTRAVWLALAARLGARHRIVIPDLPGWGETRPLDGAAVDDGIDAQAARLGAFVDEIAQDRVVLVGHSMGGAIAGTLAAERPERVAGLVLLDSFGLDAPPTAFEHQVRGGDNPFLYRDAAGFERANAFAFDRPHATPAWLRRGLVRLNADAAPRIEAAFARLAEPAQTQALQRRLGEIRSPVLGLWCRGDRIVDPAALESLRRGLSGDVVMEGRLLEGCGHMPMMEQAVPTAAAITGFIEGIAMPAAGGRSTPGLR